MTEVLRMRATLEDNTSGSLARIRQNMRAAGTGVDTSKTRREFQQLVQPIRQVTDNVTGGMLPAFDKMKFSFATTALVITGVGYATVKAAQQFRDFSRSVADLKFAAAGMDVSTQNLVAFQKAAKQFRIDPEQSSAAMQTFTKNADDFRKKIGSLREELYKYRAGDLVEGIRQTTDNIDALRLAMERIQKIGERDPASARRLSEMLFGTADVARMKFEDVAKAMERVRATGLFTPEQIQASEEFRKQWDKLASTVDEVKNRLMFGLLPGFTAALKGANTVLDATIKGMEKLRDLMTGPDAPTKREEGGGWGQLPHMYRKKTSLDANEEMNKFGELLKKANAQLERLGDLSPFGPGNGGVINAALTTGGGVGRGGGGWGSQQYPAIGGRGGGGGGGMPFGNFGGGSGGGSGVSPGGGRSRPGGIPSDADMNAADKRWWGGDNQGDVGRPSGAGGTVGGDFMKGRERAAAELEAKPWLKEKLFGIVMGENKDYNAGLSVMESAMNRAAVRGTSLEKELRLHAQSGINENGYYAGYRPRDVARYRERLEKQLGQALGGSNVSDYATDNASSWLAEKNKRTGRFVMRKEYGGETFFRPGYAEKGHAQRWQQMHADALNAGIGARGSAAASIDRSMIDSAIAPPSVNATGSVNIDVHAPTGTKVAAKSEGMFQQTKINRQIQMGGPDEP